MKKLLIIIGILLLPLAGQASAAEGKTVPKGKLAAVISEFRHYDGVEVVQLGRLSTAALKGVIRIAASEDPDAKAALKLLRGIKRLSVFEYEDCAPAVRERITKKLERAFEGADAELLMEAKDAEDTVRMYGVMDEKTGTVRDFVLYTPSDCTLVCIFGSISMDAIAELASHE